MVTKNKCKYPHLPSPPCFKYKWGLFTGIILGNITGGVLFLLIVEGLFNNPLSVFYKSYILATPVTEELTSSQKNVINELVSNNVIISANDLLSHLSSFYTQLVGFLGIMIPFIILLGGFYIFFLSKKEINEEVENKAQKFVENQFKTQYFSNLFDDKLKRLLTDYLDDYLIEDIGSTIERLDKLSAEIKCLKENISNNTSLKIEPPAEELKEIKTKLKYLENNVELLRNNDQLAHSTNQRESS